MSVINNFIGANSTSKGIPGLVPAAPAAGDTGLFLRSDGEWAEVVSANTATIKQTVVATGESHLEAINREYTNTPSVGDIVILKELIYDENIYQTIAYIYSNNEWIALDGNYDIEKIYLSTDLTITADIGVQKLNGAGSKKLETAGKNLKQVLDMILASRELPTYESPSVSVICNQAGSYEVGTVITPSYKATFNVGKYQFDPKEKTGVVAETWKASFDGQEIFEQEGIFNPVVITDNYEKRVSITVGYSKGDVPKDNLGNLIEDENELKNCQIQSGEKINYSEYIKGFRNIFYGSKNEKIDLTSDNLRKLSKKIAAEGSFNIPVTAGTKQVIIAVPSEYSVESVADKVAFGTNIFSCFELKKVFVNGATEGYEKEYNVYIYSPSIALGENVYTVTVV